MTQVAISKLYQPTLHSMFESIPDDMALNPDMIAEMLNMSLESVRRWCRTGQLQNYNFGNKYVIMGSDFKYFLKKSKSKRSYEGLHLNSK